jgi:alanine dehydrogenase
MIIGVPKEIKIGEFRVALTPAGAETLRSQGHHVWVEKGAGEHAGFPDSDYRKAGARLVHARQAWSAKLVVKVKEPLPSEFKHLRPQQILFTFLHLAPNPRLVQALLKNRVTAVAYEAVEEEKGKLPILEPMSEIAGRIAALMGAYYQANPQGGRGVLFGGMPGVLPAHVVILGGGTVGENAARVALGMGSRVTILERRSERMRYLDEILPHVETLMADPASLRSAVSSADILIGAVHIPGARTPMLLNRSMVRRMKPRSVIIDVAIDQGGSSETSRPTSHAKPIYLEEDVLHYCVPNIPGAYGRTSTLALTNVTLNFIVGLSRIDLSDIPEIPIPLQKGVQCYAGSLTSRPVAESLKRSWRPLREIRNNA